MANNFNLYNLYKQVFNRPFSIAEVNPNTGEMELFNVPQNESERGRIRYSQKGLPFNKISALGADIWFPLTLWISNDKFIEIEACTIGVNMLKTIIRTPISERKGTVKEQFNIDDVRFNVRGFLISKDKNLPEAQIILMKEIFETQKEVFMEGGYPEIFLDEDARVVVTALDFPQVEGRSPAVRPFMMKLESDYVQSLIL